MLETDLGVLDLNDLINYVSKIVNVNDDKKKYIRIETIVIDINFKIKY